MFVGRSALPHHAASVVYVVYGQLVQVERTVRMAVAVAALVSSVQPVQETGTVTLNDTVPKLWCDGILPHSCSLSLLV